MPNKYIMNLEGSASVELMMQAENLKKEGKNILSLAGGEPDFDTPLKISKTAMAAIQSGKTHYSVGPGIIELREKIADKLWQENDITCTAENIIVTPGGKYGIYLALASMLNIGDEVIIFSPYWVSYCPIVRACGAIPIICQLDYEQEYKITEEKILSCLSKRTKMMIINYPNNPTGKILSREEADLLHDIVKKYNLLLVSDEIYEKIIFDGKKNISMASYDDISRRVITINGFSKCVAMTGWRLGYVVASRDLIKVMYKLFVHTITGTSPFIQLAAVEAFDCAEEIEYMRQEYQSRRDYFVKELNSIPGIQCRSPEGAFYAWVCFLKEKSSNSVCKDLLNNYGVLGVDGESYGELKRACVRFSFASSMETLKDAIERLKIYGK